MARRGRGPGGSPLPTPGERAGAPSWDPTPRCPPGTVRDWAPQVPHMTPGCQERGRGRGKGKGRGRGRGRRGRGTVPAPHRLQGVGGTAPACPASQARRHPLHHPDLHPLLLLTLLSPWPGGSTHCPPPPHCRCCFHPPPGSAAARRAPASTPRRSRVVCCPHPCSCLRPRPRPRSRGMRRGSRAPRRPELGTGQALPRRHGQTSWRGCRGCRGPAAQPPHPPPPPRLPWAQVGPRRCGCCHCPWSFGGGRWHRTWHLLPLPAPRSGSGQACWAVWGPHPPGPAADAGQLRSTPP